VDSQNTAWWEVFEDEQLAFFVTTALQKHPSLQSAYARIRLAAANADRVRAALFPNLFWSADSSRQKLSETGIIPFNLLSQDSSGPTPAQTAATGGLAGIPVYFTQTETAFNLSYDFDIWGKNRNLWSAALSEVQARVADDAFARLQLGMAVAQAYFQLQVDYQRLEIARRRVELGDRFLALTQEREENNLDTATNVQSAKTNLSTARQSCLQLEGMIAVDENRLRAYLAGQFDESIAPIPVEAMPLPKVPVPSDLPLHLIAYRPDVMAQLWMIESAGKQIDVARAGFYPDVSISALFGYQTIRLHKLFEWPSAFFNVDPAVSLPIFDGGRLIANLRGSEVNYALAIADYNLRILNAVHEVLDGLALVRTREQQLAVYREKTGQQEEIFLLELLRAENDLSSDLNTINSEVQYLQIKDDELVAWGDALQAVLLLIKAAGGGYEACYIEG
jgi:NodT family efflux transporter outer membrane factor (OMF) lipoprotein